MLIDVIYDAKDRKRIDVTKQQIEIVVYFYISVIKDTFEKIELLNLKFYRYGF